MKYHDLVLAVDNLVRRPGRSRLVVEGEGEGGMTYEASRLSAGGRAGLSGLECRHPGSHGGCQVPPEADHGFGSQRAKAGADHGYNSPWLMSWPFAAMLLRRAEPPI